jgi:hypothetical protein
LELALLNFPDEVGEAVGHGRRTSTVLFPQPSPDCCSDLPHAVCFFSRQQDAIPTHEFVRGVLNSDLFSN